MDDKQAMHAMSIDDAYHVERTLARGPSGVTELVSIDGNGPFVRKKIPSPLAQRNVWAALSACQSNRLPRVEATYELPDRFVIVYDYVPGSTLAQIAEENGRLAPNVAVQLIDQICEAVQELHQHGVIHRDITPANVIVAQDGAHLIDHLAVLQAEFKLHPAGGAHIHRAARRQNGIGIAATLGSEHLAQFFLLLRIEAGQIQAEGRHGKRPILR